MMKAIRPTVPTSMRSISERLRWAAQQQPREGRRRGLRLFQTRMEERAEERAEELAEELAEEGQRELVGCSLSAIQGYVSSDGPEPSIDFLREAAQILNVRLAWLAAGDGYPTVAEQAAAWESWKLGPSPLEVRLRKKIYDWRYLGDDARASIAAAWAALVGDRDPEEMIDEDAQATLTVGDEVARQLGRALDAPLDTLGLNRGVIPPEMDDYLILLCRGLQLYLRGQQRAHAGHDPSQHGDTDAEA